jgi:hypothetical protein
MRSVSDEKKKTREFNGPPRFRNVDGAALPKFCDIHDMDLSLYHRAGSQ